MKILAAGDLHGDQTKVKELARLADKNKVDLVVLCGDIVESELETKNMVGPFIKNNRKVLLVPGNHETIATVDFLAQLYDVTNLHGYSIKINDIGFFGCGLANMGLFSLKEDEIYSILKKGFDKIKDSKKTIMVTHVHPSGTKMEKFSKFVLGSSGVEKAIKNLKPDILLCSHVHEAQGIEEKIGKTKIINVGRRGKIIEI